MISKTHHIFLMLFMLPAICLATVEVFEKRGTTTNSADNWVKATFPSKISLTFLPIAAKPGRRLVYKGTITFPKDVASAEQGSETTGVAVEKNVVKVQVLSFEEKIKIKFADSTETEIKLVMTEPQFRLYSEKCKELSINIRVAPVLKTAVSPPFPMGISCDKYEDKIIMVVSIPADVEPGEGSLVEGGGKGESWKFYELPSTAREDGVIGGIKYKVKNVEMAMALQNIRLKKKEDEIKKDLVSKDLSYFQDMSLGLGTKSLAFTAGDVSASSSGIAIDAGILSKPVWRKFQLGISYSMALASSSENSISFSDFSGVLGYSIPFTKSKLMPFGFGKFVDFLHKSTQTRLQATLAGVGVDYRYELARGQISFNLEMGIFAAKGISSQMRYQLGYQYYIKEKSKLGLGIFYDNQDFKAVNTAGEGRTFKEGNILLKVVLNSN
ncbi:MAG: hypothetical protein B7Y39_04050 [Bdellovibrio sp. 28-41-41]|nr:MAG: hypothetical protein B7Y39_04050 [Bdellovibrio sp. 28-41-41]